MSVKSNSNNSNNFSSESLKLLTLAYTTQIDLVKYHCELAFKIFTWYTTVLLAVLGFSISQVASLQKHHRLLLAFSLCAISGIVYLWQRNNRLQAIEHSQNAKRIDALFHFTEQGYYCKETDLITTKKHLNEPLWCSRYGFSPYNLVIVAITGAVLIILIFF